MLGTTIPHPRIRALWNIGDTVESLQQIVTFMRAMRDEYETFWESLVQEDIRPGTEQDCIQPYTDPNGRCVHFEADLKERLQRIGARPAILLKEDFLATGAFRNPLTHGQVTCERQDWACQLLNATEKAPREGWLLEHAPGFDPDENVSDIRESIRNLHDPAVPYDIEPQHIFQNFTVPIPREIE